VSGKASRKRSGVDRFWFSAGATLMSARNYRFSVGRLVATPGALDVVTHEEVFTFVERHRSGDWGDVCPEDWAANDQAKLDKRRIFSAYTTASGHRIWIITEWDRSITTILLASPTPSIMTRSPNCGLVEGRCLGVEASLRHLGQRSCRRRAWPTLCRGGLEAHAATWSRRPNHYGHQLSIHPGVMGGGTARTPPQSPESGDF
jgi:hypothetical protein